MSKPKYSAELKIWACEVFLSGKYLAAQFLKSMEYQGLLIINGYIGMSL